MRRAVMTGALIAVLAASAAAGAWPRKAGGGFVQLGFSTIGYDQVYDDAGEKVAAPATVRDNVLQLFAEYGITDDFTVGLQVPFAFLSVSDPITSVGAPGSPLIPTIPLETSTTGLGDIVATAQVALLRSRGSVFSAGVLFGFPTGDTTSTEGLWTGDGEFNVAPRFLYGLSLHPAPVYLAADAGYNIRGSGYSDEVFGNLEAGYGFLDGRLYAIVTVSVLVSTDSEPSRDIPAARLGLYNNNREFVAFTPKLLYKFGDGLGVVASYATAASGRNVAGGAVLAASVFYEF